MNNFFRGFGVCVAAAAAAAGTASAQSSPCVPAFANELLTPICPGTIRTIRSFDDGTGAGPRFFAGGTLSGLGGVAYLTPTGWARAGSGLFGTVSALEVIDGPAGPTLLAGGDFSGGLATWTGSAWQAVTPGPGTGVTGIIRFDDGLRGGPALYVLAGNQLRKQTSAGWSTVAVINVSGSDRSIDRILVVPDLDPSNHRPSIVIASSVISGNLVGQTSFGSTGLVRYDGVSLVSMPTPPYGSWIKSAVVFDDALHGPSLFVSGHAGVGGVTTSIARFDARSQTWTEVGPRVTGSADTAYAMDVFADGASPLPRLWAIGGFGDIAVVPFATIAAWDGTAWTRVARGSVSTPSSMGYHLPSHVGTLGTARVPALLCASLTGNGTSMFAVLGCPRCLADANLDGQLTVNDLFIYLDAWFAHGRSADIGTPGQSVQDIFDYMNAWWTGCP